MGSVGATFGGLADLLFKFHAGDCPLLTPLSYQLPKLGTTSQFQLFSIEPFDSNDQCDRLAVPSNHDPAFSSRRFYKAAADSIVYFLALTFPAKSLGACC